MIELGATGYFITVDSYSYALKRRGEGVTKKGERIKTESIVGYYSSLHSAILAALENCKREIFSEDTISLNEALDIIKRLNAEFLTILERLEK